MTSNPQLKRASSSGPPGLVCLFSAESLLQAGSRCSCLRADQTGAGEGALAFIRVSLPLLLAISHSPQALSPGQEQMILGGSFRVSDQKIAF